jgi:hypothetical protein
MPGKGYYLQGTALTSNTLVVASRTCHSCLSQLTRCTISTNATPAVLEVEYISMMMVANASIVANSTYCRAESTKHNLLCSITTQQEFLFKLYFKNRYPDLMLIFGTFGHDRKKSFEYVDKALRHTIEVIDETGTANTSVIWFTTASVYAKKLKKVNKKCTYENGMTIHEKIEALNHVLHNALNNRVEASTNPQMFGFWDLFYMSKDIGKFWAEDHVHYLPHWYKYVIGYILHALGN